jgi:hypothetical protein
MLDERRAGRRSIRLAMAAHTDDVSIEQAHHSLSTAVIAHTLNSHRDVDAQSRMHVAREATFAGRSRGRGQGGRRGGARFRHTGAHVTLPLNPGKTTGRT